MLANYKGNTYECELSGNEVTLYSDKYVSGFLKDFEGYVKIINRKDCERVYRQENRFLYKGKSFRYRDESDGKILLIDNSKNNGFELRLDYDEYGKWVNISDGEKIIWTEEF